MGCRCRLTEVEDTTFAKPYAVQRHCSDLRNIILNSSEDLKGSKDTKYVRMSFAETCKNVCTIHIIYVHLKGCCNHKKMEYWFEYFSQFKHHIAPMKSWDELINNMSLEWIKMHYFMAYC